MNPYRFMGTWLLLFLVGCSSVPRLTDPRPKPDHIFSVSKVENGVTVTVSNVRLAEPSPQQRILIASICVSDPDHSSLSIDGTLVYPGGEQEFGRGLSSVGDPVCEDFDFNFLPDDELSQVEFKISAITNWSYTNNQTLKCAQVAEEQRLLDEWKTGIKVSCKQNGSSAQWLEAITFIPPTMSQEEAEDWLSRASGLAFDAVLVTHGAWNFAVKGDDINRYEVLKLLGPDIPGPLQRDLDVQALNPKMVGHQIHVDVCLKNPLQSDWLVWDALLAYDNNTKPIKSFQAEASTPANCAGLTFKIPEGAVITQATLDVLGISFPPDIGDEKGCKKYLPALQAAIARKYIGMWIKCSAYDDGGWYIDDLTKPYWMNDFDATWLILDDELFTVKGNWSFDLTFHG